MRVAREQLRDGADFIKIMVGDGPGCADAGFTTDHIGRAQITAEEVRAIVNVTEGHGASVYAYAHSPRAIRLAVENGVKGIEHGTLIDEQTARYMAEKEVWFTPTLIAYAGNESTVAELPSYATGARNSMMLDQIAATMWHAHGARVKMCHGSDLLSPFQRYQSREFGMKAAVLDNKTVLQGATVNAAEMLGQDWLLRQVKEGFAADLLVLNENPLKDVRILAEPEKHILAVIKNGRVCVSRWSKLPVDCGVEQTMIE
jgi:imidazolonepropionase-like amidohydrolase